MRKQCVLFFFLACVGLSLAACGGGGGGGSSASNAGPDSLTDMIFPGAAMVDDAPIATTLLGNVFGNVDNCADIGGGLCMKGGSIEIYDSVAWNAATDKSSLQPLLEITDKAGGDLKLYTNGFLLAEISLDSDNQQFMDTFIKEAGYFSSGGYPSSQLNQAKPYANPYEEGLLKNGTYGASGTGADHDSYIIPNDNGPYANGTFTGTAKSTQLFATFVGTEDFSLEHSTFGIWSLRQEINGTVTLPDGTKKNLNVQKVGFHDPFYSGNQIQQKAPEPGATYSGPIIGIATKEIQNVVREVSLTGTATAIFKTPLAQNTLTLAFPNFYDFQINNFQYNGETIYNAHNASVSNPGTEFTVKENNNTTGITFNSVNYSRVETQFYGSGGTASEGVGRFYIWGPDNEGSAVAGSFGMKK